MLTRKKQYVHVVAVSARGIWRDTYHLRGIESSSIGGAQFYWLQSPNIILEKENMKQQPNKKVKKNFTKTSLFYFRHSANYYKHKLCAL